MPHFINCLVDVIHPDTGSVLELNSPININNVHEMIKGDFAWSNRDESITHLPCIHFLTGTNHDPMWMFANEDLRDVILKHISSNKYPKLYKLMMALQEHQPEVFVSILNGVPQPPPEPPTRLIRDEKVSHMVHPADEKKAIAKSVFNEFWLP